MNDKFWDLLFRLVPDHGVADTVQGELLRAVLRLTAECTRNGCGNWDDYFEALADLAWEKFSDRALDPAVAEQARAILARLRDFGRSVGSPEAGPLNHRMPIEDKEGVYFQLCRDIDEPLEKAAVQWCEKHPDPIPFLPGPGYEALD